MKIDLDQASAFMAGHARLLDRRRFDLVTGQGDASGALAAVMAYRNSDGGFGWGLEPDLRSPESQIAGALHAFEVFEETREPAPELCDWLGEVTLPDGGLPFALPLTQPAGSSPWWASADSTRSSLQLTAAVTGAAHRAGMNGHPWLRKATEYCLARIAERTETGFAIEFRFVLWFLDAIGAEAELERMVGFLPDDWVVPVEGGVDGEAQRPLDFSPWHEGPLRALMPRDVLEADLARLAALQQDDGGWVVDFVSASPAASLEWRGYATVDAVKILLPYL
ncbi:hypothetical protein [Amycolatopsis sp. NPDC059657]|uniref:hypothetical protein n=1 Tax=Amycolatopsis sp. NPDC059657 TaxID=3346899 RepID=UPI00366B1B97